MLGSNILEKQITTKRHLIVGLILSLLLPGAGHVYFGYAKLGLGILLFAMAATVGLSFFAVMGPWAMGLGFLFNVFFHILVLIWVYWIAKMHGRRTMTNWSMVLILGLLVIHALAQDLQRVRVFIVPSEAMDPEILAGDRVAVDRSVVTANDLSVGTLVVVTVPNRPGEYVRKVKSLNGDVIAVAANDTIIPTESLAIENIKGRILYVVYSVDSSQFRLRGDRFLKILP